MTRKMLTAIGAGVVCAALWVVLVISDQSAAQMAAGLINAKQNGTWNVGLSTGSNTIGAVNQGTANATPWNENISQWGGTGTTLGQKTMSASVPVVISSDQSTISTTQGALTSIATGQQAVTTSAAALPSAAGKRVCLKVLVAGSQTVYFGASAVTTSTGQELSPGDATCLPLDNANRVYVIAAATGSTVAYDVEN